jgi:hypothetical protein
MRLRITLLWLGVIGLAGSPVADAGAPDYPHPIDHPDSARMLTGDWFANAAQIDFGKLPQIPARHALISDVRDQAGTRVHQHAYLARHAGRYWAMWSDGPGLPRPGATPAQHRNRVPGHDRPGTRVSYATSGDGLNWSKPRDLSGPPRIDGFGWIARGLWVRDGELLALASHFNAPGYSGKGLSLEAFRWDEKARGWVPHGTVLDDSLNNFPPKKLPTGEWMMTRRDHERQVSVMIGGAKGFNDWRIRPLASYDGKGRPEEPYWFILPDGKNIVGLIRDNGGSKRLLRTYSTDSGRSWSRIVRTNFPDATSKFFVLRTSRGYYVMVSNGNPRRRDPLTLAVSPDGLVFTKLFRLIGGRHIDYPHLIEHDGHLLIAFSGAKQTMEVMKVSLTDLEQLKMPASVKLDRPLAPLPASPSGLPDWIDLGDEGRTIYATVAMTVPQRGKVANLSLATSAGQERVTVGVDARGLLTARLYRSEVSGPKMDPGARISLLIRISSHRGRPDELSVQTGPTGEIPAAPGNPDNWTITNRKGDSNANLARALIRGEGTVFHGLRIAHDRAALATAAPVNLTAAD